MTKKFMEIVEMTKCKVSDISFMLEYRTKPTYFTRNTSKMQFSDTIYFILKGIKKSLQFELDTWFENLGVKTMMTKQSFSELRQKIDPAAFVDLNDTFVNWFYKDDKFKTYKGYRLLAIDGSITEIPNTERNQDYFGYYHNQSKWKQSRAMACIIYDIENDCIIESDIRSWKSAERTVAKELIDRLSLKGHKNDLFLFDRGYPSKDMFNYLEKKNVKFLMRVKNNKFHSQFDNALDPDQIVTLLHNNEHLRLRIINVKLSTGEVEKLVTNIMDDDLTNEDFKELYFKRWGIETKYNQLKSRYELENFSGCSPVAIMQDFYANIYLSNMLSNVKEAANETIKAKKQGLKYEYKVNMNILVGKMIPMLIKCFFEDKAEKRVKLFKKVMNKIVKNIVPIRPDRHFPRREPSRKNKYPYTRRRVL